MRVSAKTIERLKLKVKGVNTDKVVSLADHKALTDLRRPPPPPPQPAPPKAKPQPDQQAEAMKAIAEALKAQIAKSPEPMTFKFDVARDDEGRIASITATPVKKGT